MASDKTEIGRKDKKNVNLCTKLCADVFIYYGDISIFTKFNMAAVRHIGFVGGSCGTTHEGQFMGRYHVKNSKCF